ncbi:MAG: NAD(+)/NADH kinase [Planctomycetes bacterium]|nr:NAD(+)/NADH kinase [Planctomycetota bacterium]
MPRIAILGGSFDPPGRHQRELAQQLAELFDRVIVVPTGTRSDRDDATDTAPVNIATMADIAFRGLPKVEVDLSDLENEEWTQPYKIEARWSKEGDVWFVVPAELVRGGHDSPIGQKWERADQMWLKSRFLILQQPNEPLDADLPMRHELLEVKPFLPASSLRMRVYNHESIDDWVLPEVNAYIQRHGLYRGVTPSQNSTFHVRRPRFKIFYDPRNETSQKIAATLKEFEAPDPELIVVIGGDGTMLHAIRQLWRERIPFYGVNTGHLGFLLNDRTIFDEAKNGFWNRDLRMYQLPLLWTEAETLDSQIRTGYAFNEVWVERASGQTAWIQLRVNGQVRLTKVVCDGALVSTAAGSTSYARAMGAAPLPFTTPVLILAGSNVLTPIYWRQAVLPLSSEIELTTIDPEKRPLTGYVDGVSLGQIWSMKTRISRTAAVELAFQPEHDPSAKLARLQFNSEG